MNRAGLGALGRNVTDARVGDLVAVTELAGERLVDPAWVSEAVATAGLTRDW